MRLFKMVGARYGSTPWFFSSTERSHRLFGRQSVFRQARKICLTGILAGSLAACSGGIPNPFEDLPNPFEKKDPAKQVGESGFIQGFLGGVVADEPQATIVGREILSAGGSAADAVTAMYFTLAVTKPTEAGLGGGGVCVIRDVANRRTDTLDFRSVLPTGPQGRPLGGVPVPGNPRGFAVLHAKVGKLKWGQVLRPAENLARFGSIVSRSFATDFRNNANRLAKLPAVVHLFRKRGGGYLAGEGDRIERARLAGVLSRIRVRGVGDFYQGQLARSFVADANRLGGRLSIEHLRSYRPIVRPTIVVPYDGGTEIHLPSPPGPGGAMAADLTSLLMEAGVLTRKSEAERRRLVVEAADLAARDRTEWLMPGGRTVKPAYHVVDEDRQEKRVDILESGQLRSAAQGAVRFHVADGRSATGLAAIDSDGSAVACTVTMNQPFGSGRVAPSLGILLAQPVGRKTPPPASATPLIVASRARRDPVNEFVFMAATATGGPQATAALVDMVVRVSGVGESLESVLTRPRLQLSEMEDAVIAEDGIRAALVDDLRKHGHKILTGRSQARVNGIYCETGVPQKFQSCAAMADPRGFGLGVIGDE